jgi:hypothetical protein
MVTAIGVLFVPFAALGLGGCGGDGRSDANGSGVPVVTSIVGDTVPGGSLPGGTRPPSTAGSPGGAIGGVPKGYGEPQEPMAMPATTVAVVGPEAPAVGDAARGFLSVFWAGGTRTYAEMAEQLAPFATESYLATYRDASMADQPVSEQVITDQSVEVTEARDTTATAVGRGTSAQGTRRASVWRTLALVKDDAGAWKVDSLR